MNGALSMRKIRSMPFIILIFSVVISITIALFSNISFNTFLKRTFVFYIIIFCSAQILTYHLLKIKTSNPSNKIDIIVPPEGSNEKNEKSSKDDFTPLDFREYEIKETSAFDQKKNES